MKITDYYKKYQHTCLSLKEFNPSRITRTIELIPEKDHKILDIGCANGILSELFKKKGNSVVGIEINEKLAAKSPLPEDHFSWWKTIRRQDGTAVRP